MTLQPAGIAWQKNYPSPRFRDRFARARTDKTNGMHWCVLQCTLHDDLQMCGILPAGKRSPRRSFLITRAPPSMTANPTPGRGLQRKIKSLPPSCTTVRMSVVTRLHRYTCIIEAAHLGQNAGNSRD